MVGHKALMLRNSLTSMKLSDSTATSLWHKGVSDTVGGASKAKPVVPGIKKAMTSLFKIMVYSFVDEKDSNSKAIRIVVVVVKRKVLFSLKVICKSKDRWNT
jgi:hypothetical protein